MPTEYDENHAFAVFFTIVAAASQGLGGLIAVMTMKEYGPSVAHLMSFSTGVMIYLSFMDIMVSTTQSVGELAASLAFFAGAGLFLALEFGLPEVESSQLEEVFGFFSWAPSPRKSADGLDGTVIVGGQSNGVPESSASANASSATKSTLHQRFVSGRERPPRASERALRVSRESDDGNETSKPAERAEERVGRAVVSPKPTRAAHSPRKSGGGEAAIKRQRSPPPSEKRLLFAREGEEGMSETRKRAVAFSGFMVVVSISLHNIPEGIAVYLTCLKGVKSGLPLAIAMSLHNIPEGMAVAGPIFAATKSKRKAVIFATASGAFELVGCLLVQLFFDRITPFFMETSLSLVAGIMVALALIELLPSCLEVLSPRMMGCSCLSGMVFMFLSKSGAHFLSDIM